MRTSLTMGLALALSISAAVSALAAPAPNPAPAPGNNAGAGKPYTIYSSIPRVPGIKTLVDFNDYDNIIAAAKGYVNVRYLPEGGAAAPAGGGAAAAGSAIGIPDHAAAAARVGAETGMPVIGFTMDPAHSAGYIGANGQPATGPEADTHMMRQLTKVSSLFITPDPARQSDAYASTINRTNPPATPDYANLPKDRFGGVVYTLSQEDMILDNWVVELNSSANTIPNRRASYAKTVTNFNGDTEYLGVRVRFPTHDYNANARVAPAYPMPAFDARGYPVNYGFFDPDAAAGGANPFTGDEAPTHQAVDDARVKTEDLAGNPTIASAISYNGVIHNVADIREIVVKAAGRNYRNGVAIRLRNQNGELNEYFLGYLDFVGWRNLRWVNPNYLPADESEPFRLPLYPTEIPYIAFDSLIIYRNGEEIGGDFVAYFEDIKLDYDLAVPASQLNVSVPGFIDIDDDAWWYILRDRNQATVEGMMREFSRQVDLRRQTLGRTTRHAEGVSPTEQTGFPPLTPP